MDAAFSTTHPASSLLPAPFLSASNPRDLHLLKPPSTNSSLPPIPHLSTKPNFNPNPNPLSLSKPFPLPALFPPPPLKSTAGSHRKASTGYAAALLDAARCAGALPAVARDARRFSRAVRDVLANPSVDEGRKGDAVRAAAEGSGFDRRLVALVRMLVRKGRVGLVGEVMGEVGRIWEELRGIRRVVVVVAEEGRRAAEEEVAGIAEDVRRVSGGSVEKFHWWNGGL